MDDTDRASKPTPKRPGPAATRSSRQETFRISSKARREALLASGKVEIKAYISPEAKAILISLKEELNLTTLGEAIEVVALIQQKHQKT